MKRKPVIPRELAVSDIEEAVDSYIGESTEDVALAFVGSLEDAFGHIARHPESGSPRFAHELQIPGMRYWPVKGFPYLVFYQDLEIHVDLWRVLHAERDIPAWLREPG